MKRGIELAHNSDILSQNAAIPEIDRQSTNDELNVLAGHLNAIHAAIVELVARALAAESWAGEGVRSPQQWLTWQLGITTGEAQRFLDLAAARETHPVVSGKFAAGELSLTQAAIATSVDPTRDREVGDLVQACTIHQLRMHARAMKMSDDDARKRAAREQTAKEQESGEPSPTLPDPDPRERRSTLEYWYDEHGRILGRFDLGPEDARIVDAALHHSRDLLFHDHDEAIDPEASVRVTGRRVNWADALVEMARRSLDADESSSRRERFRINLFLDPSVKPQAVWSDHTAVPSCLLDKLSCDGTLTPTFVENGKPVSVGRALRIVPDRTRRLVIYRDHHKCRMPWCERTRWLEVHHVKHWAAGGATDTDSLIAACDTCHDAIHRGELSITGNADEPDGLTFTDRHGNPIEYRTPVPAPPAEPPPTPIKRYAHPLGERLAANDVWVNPSRAAS